MRKPSGTTFDCFKISIIGEEDRYRVDTRHQSFPPEFKHEPCIIRQRISIQILRSIYLEWSNTPTESIYHYAQKRFSRNQSPIFIAKSPFSIACLLVHVSLWPWATLFRVSTKDLRLSLSPNKARKSFSRTGSKSFKVRFIWSRVGFAPLLNLALNYICLFDYLFISS